MQLGAVLAPIAAATIVNAILAWFAWRGTVVERRTGKLPRRVEVGLVGYLTVMAVTVYLLKDARINTPLSLFGAVLVGEAMGIMIAQTAAQAFLGMKGQPWHRRAFPALAAAAFTVAVFAGVFAT